MDWRGLILPLASGTAKVRHTLTARPGTWAPAPVTMASGTGRLTTGITAEAVLVGYSFRITCPEWHTSD